jgi:hypothetical protein
MEREEYFKNMEDLNYQAEDLKIKKTAAWELHKLNNHLYTLIQLLNNK